MKPRVDLTPAEQEALLDFFWAWGQCRGTKPEPARWEDPYLLWTETKRFRRAANRAFDVFGYGEAAWRRRKAPTADVA